jgi:hypothetical protein
MESLTIGQTKAAIGTCVSGRNKNPQIKSAIKTPNISKRLSCIKRPNVHLKVEADFAREEGVRCTRKRRVQVRAQIEETTVLEADVFEDGR